MEPRRVTGQVASRYPLNMFCAMPTCPEVADDPHHIFPRSQIGNDFWFVQAWDAENQEMFSSPLAHVTGLCRMHHRLVEDHKGWIQLDEKTLEFYWSEWDPEAEDWVKVGTLDPQPGGREKNNRPKRTRFTSDEDLKKRKSVSVKLPVGVNGLDWKTLLDEAEATELEQPDTKFDPDVKPNKQGRKVATGKLLIAVLERFTGRA